MRKRVLVQRKFLASSPSVVPFVTPSQLRVVYAQMMPLRTEMANVRSVMEAFQSFSCLVQWLLWLLGWPSCPLW
eukprot:6193591-Amphidinium_carterae.1